MKHIQKNEMKSFSVGPGSGFRPRELELILNLSPKQADDKKTAAVVEIPGSALASFMGLFFL